MNDFLLLGAARSGLGVVAQAIANAGGFKAIDARGRLPEFTPAADETARLLCAADDDPRVENLGAAAGFLDRHPGARAVVVWRPAVDFVNSRLRAHRGGDFLSHCLIWAASARARLALAERFPGRVLSVAQGRLRDQPDEVAAELGQFFDLPNFTRSRAASVFRQESPGRSAGMVDVALDDPARTGWAMAEIALFLDVCGAPGDKAGVADALRAAEARRPLDLRPALLGRAMVQGSVRVEQAEARTATPVVSFASRGDDVFAPPAALRLTVAAGGRRKLRLRLEALSGDGVVRLELVENLSRRPLFVGSLALAAGSDLTVERFLPLHEGLIDIAFTKLSAITGQSDSSQSGRIAVERLSLSAG